MGGSFIFRFVSFFSTHNKVILLLLISSLFCFVFSLFCIEVFQEGLRKDTSFEDPDLQSLSSRLQATVLLARAPGTVNMYDRAFRKWGNSPYARRSCRISLLILCMLLFIYSMF